MNSLKVLIADDGWMVREGVAAFPWAQYNCLVVGEAEDGIEALVMAKAMQPDIVISDIKMPGMDGLELSQKLKEWNPNIEILLLTGYDQFDFAQTAIRFGVFDYLLKPTNFDELHQVVKKLTTEMRLKEENKRADELIRKQYKNAIPYLRSWLTHDLLYGNLCREEDIETKLQQFELSISHFTVITSTVLTQRSELNEPWLLEMQIENVLQELFSRYTKQVLFNREQNQYTMILCFAEHALDENCLDACQLACTKAQTVLKERHQVEISFGISAVHKKLSQMNLAFYQAKEAAKQGEILGNGSIVCYSDISENTQKALYLPTGEKKYILDAIFHGKEEEISQLLRQYMMKFADFEQSVQSVKLAMIELLVSGIGMAGEYTEKEDQALLRMLHQGIDYIYPCNELDGLIESMELVLRGFARHSKKSINRFQHRAVDEIMDYITEHFQEDLSLDHLAESFYLSNAYISRLIKKYTGSTFMEHVTELRLQEACSLMRNNPELRIHEIAERVGYHDISYFIQVFKKRYGKTPREYQNTI